MSIRDLLKQSSQKNNQTSTPSGVSSGSGQTYVNYTGQSKKGGGNGIAGQILRQHNDKVKNML